MDKNTKALLSLPAVRFAPFFAAGMLAAYHTEAAGLIFAAAALLALSLIKFRKAAVSAAGLLAGMLVMTLYSALYIAPITEYDGKTVRGEMLVTEISSTSQDTQRLTAEINLGGRTTSVRVSGQINAEVGDIVTADITLSLPPEKYRDSELSNGILLYGSAENVSEVKSSGFSLRKAVSALRQQCISNVKACFEGDAEAVLLSMMFGEDSLLTARLSDAFAVSGTTHFTAVSGTHFMIFATVLPELFFDRKKRVGAVVSAALVPVGILFFGFSPSVIRAGVMLLIFSAAPLFCRRSECLNTLCVAASGIMLFSPSTVTDAGFAMSVLGVLGAAVVGPRIGELICGRIRNAALRKAANAVVISTCAVICTAPVSIGISGGISLVGAFATIILLPFLSAGMTLILLLGITGQSLFAVAAFPFAQVLTHVPLLLGKVRLFWLPLDFEGADIIAGLAAAMVIIAAFFGEEFHKCCAGMFAALTAFSLAMSFYSRENRHEINFVSSGNSAAAIVCIKDEASLLISGSGSGIARTMSDCLRKNGITRLNIISAPDADFSGALSIAQLYEIFGAETIVTSEYGAETLRREEVSAALSVGDGIIDISGTTLAAAKAGSKCSEDIVLYYGYTREAPENNAGTAVYFSSAQKLLPENGINISGKDVFTLELERNYEVTLK